MNLQRYFQHPALDRAGVFFSAVHLAITPACAPHLEFATNITFDTVHSEDFECKDGTRTLIFGTDQRGRKWVSIRLNLECCDRQVGACIVSLFQKFADDVDVHVSISQFDQLPRAQPHVQDAVSDLLGAMDQHGPLLNQRTAKYFFNMICANRGCRRPFDMVVNTWGEWCLQTP